MSMPAMDADRVYIAFPDSRADQKHYLGAFDLRDGREVWRKLIEADVITAPVLADANVYLTNLEGTMFCLRCADGETIWRQDRKATSSPTVWRGECYYSRREEASGPQDTDKSPLEYVAAARAAVQAGRIFHGTATKADYLHFAKRVRGSPRYAAYTSKDAGVGFGLSKGSAKIAAAMEHLGQGHVYGVWAYQGSKPFIGRDRLFSNLGDTVHCANPSSQEVLWKKPLRADGARGEVLDSVLTPPAIANEKLFVGSIDGALYCLSGESGDVLWRVPLGEPIIFQPAVVGGRVYVSTEEGSLFGLETGDTGDDGWAMWGATAAHNGMAV
jgi:outer membrane protein assembly factor BamB